MTGRVRPLSRQACSGPGEQIQGRDEDEHAVGLELIRTPGGDIGLARPGRRDDLGTQAAGRDPRTGGNSRARRTASMAPR